MNVYEGVIDVRVPITRTARWNNLPDLRRRLNLPPLEAVDLDVVVNYQACSDTICYRPERVRLSVSVPAGDLVYPSPAR